MKKIVSGIMLTLLFMGILTFSINIKPAKSTWTGTVYIRADGSIEPLDAPIITYNNVTYTLTDNITSSEDGIVVERDNIMIDGSGYTLQGTGEESYKGVDLNGRSNVTIKNILITKFYYGIYLYYSSKNSIVRNTITANNNYGIYLYNSSNNSISGNNVTNNLCGICLALSSNNVISGNMFFNDGLFVWNSYGNIVFDNFVNDKPLVYLEGVSDFTVGDAGQVILVECSTISVKNISLSNTDAGIQLWKTNKTKISGNNITANNLYGIYLGYSSNSTISRNNIANNYCGIYLGYSSNNSIYDNNFVDNARNAYSYNSMNVWDNGYPSGGNYWSDYNGTDLYSDPYQNDTGSDGIGDTSYIIDEDNADRYPLMGPFNCFNTSIGYFVHVISNSTIEKFEFFESNNSIRMVVSNITANQTIGFCRLTIPHILVAPPYNIAVNNTSVEYNTIFENETLSIIYFAYERSKLEIVIIPEFAPALIMQIFIIMSMLVILITKKKFFLEL